MSALMVVLKQIFPPVLRYPQRYPAEWVETDTAMDPQRPIEPGEDGCGEIKTFLLRLDAERHGRVVIRKAELF